MSLNTEKNLKEIKEECNELLKNEKHINIDNDYASFNKKKNFQDCEGEIKLLRVSKKDKIDDCIEGKLIEERIKRWPYIKAGKSKKSKKSRKTIRRKKRRTNKK